MNAIIPIPRVDITIRVATMADLPFMDELQKKYNKALGYFPTKQFEGYIEMGGVLIAEKRHEGTEARRHAVRDEGEGISECSALSASEPLSPLRASVPSCLNASPLRASMPVGYIISRDRYLKRDELGVIFQLCVAPGIQRKLIGAALVQEVVERSAYGCRLYCCWCAQDLEANYFWESMGFAPIAFRAGSGKKKRVHIFWQKRICEGDTETKWWYPCQTSSGAIREGRLVFPIPPDVHWKDVQAPVLPNEKTKALPVPGGKPAVAKRKAKTAEASTPDPVDILSGGLRLAPPVPKFAPSAANEPEPPKQPRPKRPPAATIDPKYIAAARELRDRYLEHVNTPGHALPSAGKYHLARQIGQTVTIQPAPAPKQWPEAA